MSHIKNGLDTLFEDLHNGGWAGSTFLGEWKSEPYSGKGEGTMCPTYRFSLCSAKTAFSRLMKLFDF